MDNSEWVRTNRRTLCPICGKPDWCTFKSNGEVAICGRIQSEREAGSKGAGWLHLLDSGSVAIPYPVWTPPTKPRPEPIYWITLHDQCRKSIDLNQLETLAIELGIEVETLQTLQVGWHSGQAAYTFPMWNSRADLVGLRTRLSNGQKRSIRQTDGNGLFYVPDLLCNQYLIICEGPTDLASIIDVGFGSVIGKPSCQGGDAYVVSIVEALSPEKILLIPDADTPGIRGFESLALKLIADGFPEKKIHRIVPPVEHKDARAWKTCEPEQFQNQVSNLIK